MISGFRQTWNDAYRARLNDLIAETIDVNKPFMGAEIGVAKGGTSVNLLSHFPNLVLWLIDPWLPVYVKMRAKRILRWRWDTIKNIKPYIDRCFVLRMTSEKAADRIEDGCLDFVFIDGDHTAEGVRMDIAKWCPKVKKGGLVSGHDYGDVRLDRRVHIAVDEFVADRSLDLCVDPDTTIWSFVKP